MLAVKIQKRLYPKLTFAMSYSILLIAFLLLNNSYPSILHANQLFSDKFRR